MPVEIFGLARKYNRLPLDRPQTAKHAIRAKGRVYPCLSCLPLAKRPGSRGLVPLQGCRNGRGRAPRVDFRS